MASHGKRCSPGRAGRQKSGKRRRVALRRLGRHLQLKAPVLGLALCRILVPGWVLLGAVIKLSEADPHTLPAKTILVLAGHMGIGLDVLLATLVALELMAVAVMLSLGRMARPMAIVVLSVFCLVMIGEMVNGNFISCGCLGRQSLPPGVMLAIDGVLLFGVMALDPTPATRTMPGGTPAMAAIVLCLIGVVTSFGVVFKTQRTLQTDRPQPTASVAADERTVNP